MSASASHYRPLLLLGKGGMGAVEAAAEELDDGTTRIVALKRILRTTGNDAPQVEMFLREARLTTLLQHPNVIRSFAYGESDGELFLAMEYVSGEPLSHLLSAAKAEGERLPIPIVAYILAEACEGLHAAHELRGPDGEALGVVHRDVSPHNVMVGYDGTVKLLDFGVAKIDLLDCAARTKTGEVKGKTAYMSPEQAMGDPIDRRSDLYSMGTVLFECLAGRRMWGTGTDLDVLRKLALEEPPRLSEFVSDAPRELTALFAQLTERDRTKRPNTAHELAMQLRTFTVPSGSDAGIDATAIRETMARLFDGECQRREATIVHALASEAAGEIPPMSPDRLVSQGESGPVFVTHRGLEIPTHSRWRPGLAAAVTAGLVISLAGFALLHQKPTVAEDMGPASRGSARQAAEPAPSASSNAPSIPSTTTHPANTIAPLSTTTSPVPASPVPREAVIVVPRGPIATRRASTGTPTPAAATATALAPVTSARSPRTPEPPDVDPTPF